MTATSPSPAHTAPAGSHRIWRRLTYLLSARWFREMLQTIFLIYLARTSAGTFGEFMLALSLGNILLLIGEFGLNVPLVGLLREKERDPAEALRLVTLFKGALLVAAWAGVLIFMAWQDYSPALRRVLTVIAAGVGLEALASTFFVALQVQGRQKREGQARAVAAGLGFGYGLLALILGAPPVAVAFFKLVETLVNLAGGAILCRAPGLWQWPRPFWSRWWALAKHVVVFALLEVTAVLYNRANLFFLERAAGSSGVAQYSVTWQTVDGLSVAVSSALLQSVLFPLFVDLWESDRRAVTHLAQNTARGLLVTAVLLMFFLFLESDRLIYLVFGRQYHDAVWLQKWLVPTILFSFLHNLAVFLLLAMRLERLVLVFYLAALAFNLVFCALVIPRLPLAGAALAMVCTKGFLALLTVSYCQSRVTLLTGKSLAEITAAALLGVGLYLTATGHMLRGFAEGLALLPTALLAWRWWRRRELGGGAGAAM